MRCPRHLDVILRLLDPLQHRLKLRIEVRYLLAQLAQVLVRVVPQLLQHLMSDIELLLDGS